MTRLVFAATNTPHFTCVLAMITLATDKGMLQIGEPQHYLYVKADTFEFVLTTDITTTNPPGKHWVGLPFTADCREEGMVTLQVTCTNTSCQEKKQVRQ